MFREGTLPENVITNQVISTDGFNVSAAWIGTPTVEVVGGRYYSVRATGEWGSLWAGTEFNNRHARRTSGIPFHKHM